MFDLMLLLTRLATTSTITVLILSLDKNGQAYMQQVTNLNRYMVLYSMHMAFQEVVWLDVVLRWCRISLAETT